MLFWGNRSSSSFPSHTNVVSGVIWCYLVLSITWDSVADLEKTVPEVNVDFWSRVMGRSPEDTQAEIENRIAKRGIHLLKKYSEYHKFLSERLFRLNAYTFSTADKCIFYIGKKLKRHSF